MTKVIELATYAKVAVRYPGWRVDLVGPTTVVMISVMGHRHMMTFRQRKRHRDGPFMRAVKRIVPAVILMGGMVVATGWIMALAISVSL